MGTASAERKTGRRTLPAGRKCTHCLQYGRLPRILTLPHRNLLHSFGIGLSGAKNRLAEASQFALLTALRLISVGALRCA